MTSHSFGHLQRKIQPPPLPAAFLPRPLLLERLTTGMSRRLTLVTGAPDSGKSTLVSHWLQQNGIRACWLNLEESDNQLATFLSHIVWATQVHFPHSLPTTQLIFQLPDPPPLVVVEATLINELADLPDPLVLVLDNYQLIHEPAVTRLVRQLVDYKPATIHPVIVTRGEPQLQLQRLRARKQIAEIGPAELAFNLDEAHAYLNLVAGQEVDRATAELLTEQAEGWVMGLRLAALSLPEQQADGGAGPAAGDDERYVDYFSQKVLASLSPAQQHFLLLSAIPRVFTASLCAALLAGDEIRLNSNTILEELRRNGTFLFPDDTGPGWFRFHTLFRDALTRLGKEKFDRRTLASLHDRARAWFAANGHVEEAVEHALAADNLEAAANIVVQRAPAALQREEMAALGQWLDILPPALVKQHPSLLVLQAWYMHLRNYRAPIKSLLSAAEMLLQEEQIAEEGSIPDSLPGEILALWSGYYYWHGRRKLAQTSADQAIAQLPADHPATYHARYYRALAQQTPDTRIEAAREIERTVQNRLGERDLNLSPLLRASAHLSLYALQPDQLLITANNLITYGTRLRLPSTIAWGHYFLGRLHYEGNHLELAREHFTALIEGEPPFSRDIHGDTLLALALIGAESQDPAFVTETIAALAALGGTHKAQADAFAARQALRRGDTEAALLWLENTPVPDASAYLFAIESPLFTRIRVLLALNTRDHAQEAIGLLTPALKAAQSARNNLHVVKALALRALALRKLDRRETALDLLDRALNLARGGMVRTFVDLGLPMAELLYDMVQEQDDPHGYAAQLLESFTARENTIHPLVNAANETLIEPLTKRELEILQMLYQRLSNREIAQALNISPLTVKKHTINIYQKLNVKRRQEAVSTGGKLGLIFDIG